MANPFANTVKFLAAVNLLSAPSGTTIKDLMDNLNISRRTVFRLLLALTELGFPLTDEQPKNRNEKTYRLLDSYILKLPNTVMLNPFFSAAETELLLSILNWYITAQCRNLKCEKNMLKCIREKIIAMTMQNKNEIK